METAPDQYAELRIRARLGLNIIREFCDVMDEDECAKLPEAVRDVCIYGQWQCLGHLDNQKAIVNAINLSVVAAYKMGLADANNQKPEQEGK